MKQRDAAAKQLDDCGIMTVVDEPALAHYCEQFAIWQDALASTRRKGLLITNKRTGAVHANPSINIANQAHDRLVKMMQEFGMTPSSRARVKIRPGFKRGADGGGTQQPTQNRFALIKGVAR